MLPEHAQSLFERFERDKIPLLLAGGWAVSHHGHHRFTRDVDWVCSRTNEVAAKELMHALGFEEIFDSMATRFQLPEDQFFAPIDLLWVSDETFGKMASTTERTGLHGDIPVIDLETLIAMKLHALKDNDSRNGKDLLDIRELLSKNPLAISDGKFRELCEKFSGPHGYDLVRHNR